jgi:stage II sporulation protein D
VSGYLEELMARLGALILLVACLVAVAPASAADRVSIRGRGWGHGVGMSQWGAYGFAKNGAGYRDILSHYYSGTEIGSAATKTVRVLLASSNGSVAFTGAARAGRRRLSPSRTYRARARSGSRVQLLSARGRGLGTYAAPLRVVARRGSFVTTNGNRYRGAFEVHPGVLGGVNLVNAVSLESYVRGVVARESPASWPIEALKAQAVAARTYAITTSRGGQFDHYPDTRSQVYGGVAAETVTTDQAVRETAGEVVTYAGEPVITFFFSTSGGRTEDVENTPLGNEPQPWLKSVDDPYDDFSPKHKWGPLRMTLAQADAKLGTLVKGAFKGITVVRRGTSPRIVEADIVGSGGKTRVTGGVLRARFGLNDTWAYFTTIVSGEEEPPPPEDEVDPPPGTAGDPSGGAEPPPSGRASRARPLGALAGYVLPGRRGRTMPVQAKRAKGWVKVGVVTLGRRGRYSWTVRVPGRYRLGSDGPSVRID